MKKIIIISLWALFTALAFSTSSCTKTIVARTIQPPPVDTVPFEQDLAILNSFLVKENTYLMMDVYDQFQNLYDVWPEYDKDNTLTFDLTGGTGVIYNNEIRDPYDPFDKLEFPIKTFSDTSGVYLTFVNFVHQTINYRFVSYDKTTCSFTIQFSEANVNYYIRYSKKI